MTVAVVADSACDLPSETASAAGIDIVPLTVTIDGESFADDGELSAQAFWSRIRAGSGFPSTASPSPQALLEAYGRAAQRGADAVLSVHLSRELSRTIESAELVAAGADVPVAVLDTRSVSVGEGLVALAGAAAAARGGDLDEVSRAAAEAAARLRCFAFLETVDFLRRGGRLGRGKAVLADLLRVRPLLSLEGGAPELVARPRTRARAVSELRARLEPSESAAVLHSGAAEADAFAIEVGAACGVPPFVSMIGPVTGSHLGPGALGVAFIARR